MPNSLFGIRRGPAKAVSPPSLSGCHQPFAGSLLRATGSSASDLSCGHWRRQLLRLLSMTTVAAVNPLNSAASAATTAAMSQPVRVRARLSTRADHVSSRGTEATTLLQVLKEDRSRILEAFPDVAPKSLEAVECLTRRFPRTAQQKGWLTDEQAVFQVDVVPSARQAWELFVVRVHPPPTDDNVGTAPTALSPTAAASTSHPITAAAGATTSGKIVRWKRAFGFVEVTSSPDGSSRPTSIFVHRDDCSADVRQRIAQACRDHESTGAGDATMINLREKAIDVSFKTAADDRHPGQLRATKVVVAAAPSPSSTSSASASPAGDDDDVLI